MKTVHALGNLCLPHKHILAQRNMPIPMSSLDLRENKGVTRNIIHQKGIMIRICHNGSNSECVVGLSFFRAVLALDTQQDASGVLFMKHPKFWSQVVISCLWPWISIFDLIFLTGPDNLLVLHLLMFRPLGDALGAGTPFKPTFFLVNTPALVFS